MLLLGCELLCTTGCANFRQAPYSVKKEMLMEVFHPARWGQDAKASRQITALKQQMDKITPEQKQAAVMILGLLP